MWHCMFQYFAKGRVGKSHTHFTKCRLSLSMLSSSGCIDLIFTSDMHQEKLHFKFPSNSLGFSFNLLKTENYPNTALCDMEKYKKCRIVKYSLIMKWRLINVESIKKKCLFAKNNIRKLFLTNVAFILFFFCSQVIGAILAWPSSFMTFNPT